MSRRARRAEASTSGSLAVVEPKQPAEALSASDTAFPSAGLLVSDEELAAQALVMPLVVIRGAVTLPPKTALARHLRGATRGGRPAVASGEGGSRRQQRATWCGARQGRLR